jgi:Domain of unknown function DUF1828
LTNFGISTVEAEDCLDALQSFYVKTVEAKSVKNRLCITLPLLNADGFQISIGLEQISERSAMLTDLGETLSFLECRGIATDHDSVKNLIDKQLNVFEIACRGRELTKLVNLPIEGLDIHLFGEALSGLTHLLFRHELIQAPNVHVFENVRQSLEQMKLRYVIGADASVKGLISKSIQVDFLVEAKKRVAIKTVQRRGRIHEYMEQWGYRWIDAREANPSLVRAMIYDPDNQEWDENSRAIGQRHCEIFRPYFESELIQADLSRLAA